MQKYLKYLRIIVSVALLIISSAFAAGIGAVFSIELGWIERIQFIPAILFISVTTVLLWIVVTFVFGRVYCSSVCPLGTLQDIFLRIPRLTRKMRYRNVFRYTPGVSTLRMSMLIVVFGTLVVGVTIAVRVLDPYTIFTRIFSPLVAASAVSFTIAISILVLIAWLSARRGRLWCNTICPVGAVLGVVSGRSLYHFDINTDTCTNCRKCEYVCKAQCINLNDHVVDGSRCVNCFNCVNVCPDNSISYTTRKHRLSIPMMQSIEPVEKTETALDIEK
ncbi:MAG: 4Fe-4S binding protein [Muribaculaceae bacterium]|nr:4Fe-4S binding protein [Muribaculaceae bacterium]